MKNKWLIWLLAAVFIKGIAWLLFTPIFQVPDEPSHFSYIQFLAEKRRLPLPRREVISSQELFSAAAAANFNWGIEHPVWRGYQSNWTGTIKLIDPDQRQNFSENSDLTSLKRPGLYYFLATGIYRLAGFGDFFTRFYAVRFFSLILHLLTVWLVFLTAEKITGKKTVSLVAASWMGFQPGLSFITSGVTYEPLAVLAATGFFYLAAGKNRTIYLLAVALIGIFIKPDLIFLLLLLPKMWLTLPLLLFGFSALAPIVEQTVRGGYPWLNQWLYILPIKDFSIFSREAVNLINSGKLPELAVNYGRQFLAVHWHQIFPWYWGVFGWLEKVMPIGVYTGLKILTLLSFFGLIKVWPKVKWLVLAVVIQAGVVIANDFLVFSQTGELYGLQGRYFYPAIAAQMILFVWGLSRWVKPGYLVAGAVGLNLIGLLSLFQYFGWVWGS